MIMREFNTKNFRVVATMQPDFDTDLSWDETGETREKLESGEWQSFATKVAVYFKGAEISADYLDGSIYADPADFFSEHVGLAAKSRADGCNYVSYFSDMVSEACGQARAALADVPKMRKTG